jgi:hypothetical protein
LAADDEDEEMEVKAHPRLRRKAFDEEQFDLMTNNSTPPFQQASDLAKTFLGALGD